MLILKSQSAATDWQVYETSSSQNEFLFTLNSTSNEIFLWFPIGRCPDFFFIFLGGPTKQAHHKFNLKGSSTRRENETSHSRRFCFH
jgi:hypothetical protein